MAKRTTFLCNFDDKSGALCRDGCAHPWIFYVPMASGYRCDRCRTFESVNIPDMPRVATRAVHETTLRIVLVQEEAQAVKEMGLTLGPKNAGQGSVTGCQNLGRCKC